jgi:hypothetical protein
MEGNPAGGAGPVSKTGGACGLGVRFLCLPLGLWVRAGWARGCVLDGHAGRVRPPRAKRLALRGVGFESSAIRSGSRIDFDALLVDGNDNGACEAETCWTQQPIPDDHALGSRFESGAGCSESLNLEVAVEALRARPLGQQMSKVMKSTMVDSWAGLGPGPRRVGGRGCGGGRWRGRGWSRVRRRSRPR